MLLVSCSSGSDETTSEPPADTAATLATVPTTSQAQVTSPERIPVAPPPTSAAPPQPPTATTPTTTSTTQTETRPPLVHTVEEGQVLSQIAERYGVTVEAIVEANDLDSPDFIVVGQELEIPISTNE